MDEEFDYNEFEEPDYYVEEQDLRLLKAIVSDDNAARQMSSVYGSNFFIGDAKDFANVALDYFKSYKAPPTRRVMQEYSPKFDDIWDELDKINYNKSEFSYDLDKVKDRFARHEIDQLRLSLDNLSLDTPEDVTEALQSVRKRVDKTEKLRHGKDLAYTQKTLKNYLPEFRQEMIAKSLDPDLGKGLMTGYSYLDYVTNGLQPTDMVIIGAETGGGKSMLLSNNGYKKIVLILIRRRDQKNFHKAVMFYIFL